MRIPKINRLWKFLLLFCLCYFLETITFTYLISAVESIERQFQIPSRLSGTLIASSDVGYILTVVLLAHFGSKGNRARWIGGGCLLISFACFLVAIPSFIFPPKYNMQISMSNETLHSFRLPEPILHISEVDKVGKLFTHPHIGCSLNKWIQLNNLQWLKFWNISIDTANEYLERCLLNNSLSYALPSAVMDYMNEYAKDERDFSTFVDIFVKRMQYVAETTDIRTIFLHPVESFQSVIGAPQAICSRMGNAIRSFSSSLKCQTKSTNDIAFAIVLIGIMLMGVGHSMPWTLGMPLIDDSVKKTHMPFYMAGIFFIRILGPVMGFMIGGICNRLYYSLDVDPKITPTDVNWIGAWWLGFLIVFALLFFPSLLLVFFPHVHLNSDEKHVAQSAIRQAAAPVNQRSMTDVQTTKNGIVNELNVFRLSVLQVLKSPVYTLTLLGRLLDALAFKGFFVFHSKYLQVQYGIPQYKAVIWMGLLGTVGFALGSLLGSVLMRKFKLDGRKAVAYIAACAVFGTVLNVVKMNLDCNSILDRLGNYGRQHGFNFSSPCNAHCQCENSMLFPVCSKSRMVYMSPCHAGCHTSSGVDAITNFTNCFCLDDGSSVSRDFCEDDCARPLVFYLIVMGLSGFIGGTAVIPSVLVVLRSVPIHLKSVALGFSGFLISLLSTFPSPILYGSVIDGTCLLWSENCGHNGSCSIYDTEQLRIRYFALNTGLRVFSLLFDIGVFYWAKNLKLMGEDESSAKDQQNVDIALERSEDELEKEVLALRTEAEELSCCTTL